jgi:photosystem II stability/assembly factor-like uncharacterized protein
MLARSFRLSLILAAMVIAPATAAQAASLWTQLPTGTSETISAVAWPTANEIVFATVGGHIFHETAPGVFSQSVLSATNLLGFTDLAMSPDGTKGVAVGQSGALYYSTNSGATWTKNTATTDYPASVACGDTALAQTPLIDNLYSAQFADNSTVYVTGAHRDVLKSTDGGVSFTEVNRINVAGTIQCNLVDNDDVTDSQWLDANNGYLICRYFGDYFLTTDGFSTTLGTRKGEATNSYMGPVELALNKSDPTHAWAVNGDTGVGTLGFTYTTDGGMTWTPVVYDGHQVALRDISNSGTTVVAVGDGGDIYTSPDGVHFYRQVAAAPYSANNWRTVAVLNGTDAVVGGANGVLVVTTRANQTPDTTAPTGTISGPTKLNVGQFGTYTAHVSDNPGGSGIDTTSLTWSTTGLPNQSGPSASFAFSTTGTHTITLGFRDLAGNANTATISVKVGVPPPSGSSPVTKTSGGSTVTIYKKVTVSHRKGRYIPVVLRTKKPRQFIVTLLTRKGNHQLATLTTTLKKGHKTVHLTVPSKIKTGSYKLVVIVLTTGRHSHPVGARISQVFVLS